MKDMIKFHYNLEPEQIIEQKEKYFFKVKNMNFELVPFYRSSKELEDIYQICEELKKIGISVHTFILNKENKLVSNIYSENFVLLKIEEPPEKEYNIIDIVEIQNTLHLTKTKSDLYRNQWGELWSQKIDYFEYQMHELGKEKKVILNSFTYYIGLAENAISYVNNTIEQYPQLKSNISLNHKRIDFPNVAKEYFNPIDFIFDLKVRDIAEYIKSAFFKDENNAWIELRAYLNIENLSIYEYQMFYARLLYPSYYFDVYEKIMNKEKEEKELIPYIEKATDYENFLKKVYLEISKKVPIDKVEWIVNKNAL